MTVAELDERMDAREFLQWRAFEAVTGPLLVHERVDHAGASIAWTLARLWAKTVPPFEQFLPRWGLDEPGERQTAEQMIATVRRFQRRKRKKDG